MIDKYEEKNAALKLRIESVKRIQGKAILLLSDGQLVPMPRAMLKERPYRGGMPFDREAHAQFIQTRSYSFALQKAVSLLAARSRTEQEIVTALRRNAYPEEAIAHAMAKLHAAGYLNDVDFAEQWTNSRIHRGIGTQRVKIELRRKGIDQDTIDKTISTIDNESLLDSALKTAQKSARGKDLRLPADRQKVLAALARRGFDYSISKRALEQLQKNEI